MYAILWGYLGFTLILIPCFYYLLDELEYEIDWEVIIGLAILWPISILIIVVTIICTVIAVTYDRIFGG